MKNTEINKSPANEKVKKIPRTGGADNPVIIINVTDIVFF